MSAPPVASVRRGAEPGALEFQLTDGRVLHVLGYGVDAHEQGRTVEAVLAALRASGVPVVAA